MATIQAWIASVRANGGQAWGKTGTWKGGNAAEHASIVSRGVAIRRQGKVTGEGSVIHSQGGKKIFLSAESSVSSALGRGGGKKSLPNCYNPRFVRECCTPLDRALSLWARLHRGTLWKRATFQRRNKRRRVKREREKKETERIGRCLFHHTRFHVFQIKRFTFAAARSLSHLWTLWIGVISGNLNFDRLNRSGEMDDFFSFLKSRITSMK